MDTVSWCLLSPEPSPGVLGVGGWPFPDPGLAPSQGLLLTSSRQFLVLSN